MVAKPKTVELTLRVRVPKNWSPAHAMHEVSQQWYGETYARGPDGFQEVSLFPRWSKARIYVPPKPPADTWEAHTGDDYTVLMRGRETTDSASIRVFGEGAAKLAVRIARLLNAEGL